MTTNGTDPLYKAFKEGTLTTPYNTRENLVSQRTIAFPFKKLGKYDRGITSAIYEGRLDNDPLKLQEYYRGETQSTVSKFLKGLESRRHSVMAKVGQGFGHVLGFGASLLSGDVLEGDWSKTYDNAIVRAFDSMDEHLKEQFPVHLSEQYGEGNLVSKMGTATFWASDFADGLAFLASAYIPGIGIGKIVSGASKLKMLQGLKAAGLTSGGVNIGATSIYNTVSEAGVEAYHINKELRKQLIEAGVPEEEARMRAGEAASETFMLNSAVLIAPNILQARWFHGPISNRHKLLKDSVKNGQLSDGQIASQYSAWKSALKGAASEGLWEENIQTAIERYEKRFANRDTDDNWLTGVASEWFTNTRGFLKTISPFHDAPAAGSPEDEGAMAITLGALIGAPMSAYSEFQEYKAEQQELEKIKDWWSKSLAYTDMGLKAFADDVKAPYREFVKEETVKDEDGNESQKQVKSFLNDQNRTEVDPHKMMNIMLRHLSNKKYFDESVAATIKNDALHDNFNKHLAFASFAHSLYSNPNLSEEDIVQAIDQAVKNSSETDELGINQFVQDNKKLAEAYHRDLQEIEDKISGEYDFKESPAAQSFKKNLRKSLLYAKVKSNWANDILSSQTTNQSLIDVATSIKEDADNYIEGTSKNRQEIWKAYSKFYDNFNQATKAEENLDDSQQYQKNYWARELSNTLNIDKVEHPEFWSVEPLAANRDARRTASAPYTLFEEDAASRGQMHLTNQSIQDSINNNADPAQVASQLDNVPEILPQTATLASKLVDNLESEKASNKESIDDLESIIYDIEDGLADAYLQAKLGLDYTLDDVLQHKLELESQVQEIRNRNSELAAIQNQIRESLASSKKLTPSKETLQIRFLRKELGKADILIDNHKKNPQDFSRLQEVLTEIKRVNTLIEFFKQRKDLKKSIANKALVILQQKLNRLQEAEKTAIENLSNKAKNNLIKEQQKVRSLMTGLLDARQELTNLIKDSVDFDLWMDLNMNYQRIDGSQYTTYAGVLSLIDELRSAPNSSEIIKKIKDTKAELLKEFAGLSGAIKSTVDNYERSPHQWIYTIIENYVNRTAGLSNVFKDTSLPFYQWKKTNDVYSFRDALDNMKDMEQVKLLTTYHITISSLDTILDYLQSDYSYKDIFEEVNKSIDQLTPSIEQTMATTEIIGALTSNLTGGLYDDAVYLRGQAGTGKTSVTANLVLKAFMKLTGSSKDQILVSGHKHLSADKIAGELETKATYLEDLINADLSKTRLIIIDEAAGMTPIQANEVMKKVREHNKNTKKGEEVRVFLLGDPSQITRQSIPVALQSGHVIEPITTIFRTSIGAIETAFLEFKDNPDQVRDVTVQSSHNLFESKSSNDSLFGVLSGGSLDIIDILKARQQGDGRRRVVVVNNDQAKTPYEKIPGIEVMTYEEIQGQTVDEVYVDVQRARSNFESSPFENNLEYNTAIYTAMSRARFFVFTTTPGVNSVKTDPINQTSSTEKDLFEAIKEQYGDYFNAHQFFFDKFNNSPLDITPEQEQVDEATPVETITEEVPDDTDTLSQPTIEDKQEAEDFPQKDSEEVITTEKGTTIYSHYLYYPDNAAIGGWINDPNHKGPKYTGKGHVIKSQASNDYGYTLSVIAEREDGTFDVVGVLSNKDFTDGAFGEALTREWNKVWEDPNHALSKHKKGNSTKRPITSKKVGLVKGQDFNLTVMDVTIDKIQPLEVVMDPQKRFRDMGEGFLERILTEVYRNIFKGSKLGSNPSESSLIPAEKGYVNLDQLTKKAHNAPNDVRVEIFTNKTADAIATRSDFRPKPGRAYLVIENMSPEGSTRSSKPFFIPLANLPFSKDSYYYKPLRDFYDALSIVEDTLQLKLGDRNGVLEDIIREVATQNFKGIWNDQENKYEILASDNPKTFGEILKQVPEGASIDPEAVSAVAEQIEQLIRLGFGVQWRYVTMTKEEFDSSEYANNELYFWQQQKDKQGNWKDEGKVLQKTISADTKEATIDEKNFPREYVLVANQGLAQRALDELARENEFIGDERLRIATANDRKKSQLHIMSRTLFRKKGLDEYEFMYGVFRRIYLSVTGKKLTGYSGEAVKQIVLDEGILTEEDIQNLERGHYAPPVTREMLASIVDFPGNYHQARSSQGPRYLREPLSGYMDFNIKFGNNLQSPKARKVIESKLASKVLTVNPLSVKISITSAPVSATPSKFQLTKSSIGSPLNEKMFIPIDPVKEVKEKVKKAKKKSGWIKRADLDNLIGDLSAFIDLSEAVTDTTEKSVKIDEEKILPTPSLTEFNPTVGQQLITEEDLINGIKGISPQAWKEIEQVIKGKSESERLSILKKLHQAINKDDLRDDVRYAADLSRTNDITKALGKKLTENQSKKLLNRLLPGIELTPEQVRFVSKEVLDSMAKPEEDLWGLWDRGVMYFAYTEQDGVPVFYENVIRHEVFHRIHQVHMSQQERDNLRKMVDDKYGTKNLSNYDYEEWLARHYQSWRKNTLKVRGFLAKHFKWIQRLLDFVFSNRDDLQRLFNRIDYGFFTPPTYRDTAHTSRQAMKFIKKDFGKMDVFKEAVNIVRKGFNKYLYIDPKQGGGKDGLVVSEAEAILFLRTELNDLLNYRNDVLRSIETTMEIFPEDSSTYQLALSNYTATKLRIAALEVLTKVPEKGPSPFKNLIDYLYPNIVYLNALENELSVEQEEDPTLPLEEILEPKSDTKTGVAAQIEENETKNHELKLSSSMKHWLSSIMRKSEELDEQGNPIVLDVPVSDRFGYFQMLQFFQTIDLNKIDFELRDIYEQKKAIEKNSSLGSASKMVLERLMQTIEDSVTRTYGENNIPIPSTQNLVFDHNELTGKTTYYFIEGPEASTYTYYDEVKDNSDIKIYPFKGEELIPVFNELYRNKIIDSKELFNSLYKRTIARDIIRTAQNNFKMKEMDILIASQQSDFGKTYTRYVKGRTLGIHTSLRSSFKDALYAYVERGLHMQPAYEKVKNLIAQGNHMEGIKMFLNQLGLGYLSKDFQTGNAENIAKSITETIGEAIDKKLDGTWEERNVTDPVTDEKETVLVDAIQEWIDDNETIVNDFVESLKFNFEWLRNTSVRSGDNKKLYKFSNSSFMHDLIYSLLNSKEFEGSTGNQTFIKVPEYLKTSFFRNNPFVNGLSKIYEMNYHDAFRNEYTQSTRSYDRENRSEWLRREFTFGFLNGLATSKSNAPSYHQFTYPLSDRTRIPVFRTKFLSKDEAKEAIKLAVTQIRNRNRNLSFFKGFNVDSNTNFELYSPEFFKVKDFKSLHKIPLDIVADKIFEQLLLEGEKTAKTLVDEQVAIPSDLNKTLDKGRRLWNDFPKVPDDIKYRSKGEYQIKPELIVELAQAYEVNSYINSYFVHQLFAGDQAFYKHSPDVVKRAAGPSAPGTAPFVNKEFGMKPKAKIAVVKDKSIKFSTENEEAPSIEKFLRQFLSEEEFNRVKNYFSQKGFDMTDAQGFITPERMNDIRRGFGRAFGLGNVMKPVYYSIQTMDVVFSDHPYDTKQQAEQAINTYKRDDLFAGNDPSTPGKFRLFTKEAYPIYLKYSSINLSNELIQQFPYLDVIRQKMRDASVDELIFESGVKVGKPAMITTAEEVESPHEGVFSFSNTLEIDNEHFRMQLNPRHDPDDKVSMFTQLTYFLNVFDVDPKVSNDEKSRSVYNALAFLTKKGLQNFNRSANNITGLAKRLLDTPGYESALELLEEGVSIDNPAIEKLLVTQFAAKLSNDTVGRIKFPGGKYTLQSAYGIYKNKIKVGEFPTQADELQYKVNEDGSFYAEMILPKGVLSLEQEAAVMRGDDLFLHGDGFAFRIPSTELHSAISIKVVGIYDDLKTNVIIGPKELVPLHGSDFDADSLSVILRTRAKKAFNYGNVNLDKDEFIGYTFNDKGQYIIDNSFAKDLADAMDLAKKNKDIKELRQLEKIEDDFVKNLIAEAMMEVIRHPRNRPRMLTPISMERFNGEYGGQSMKLLLKEAGDPNPQQQYDISSSIGRYRAYKSIFDGAALTGVFANGIKSLAYIVKSGPTELQKEYLSEKQSIKDSLKTEKLLEKFGDDSKALEEFVATANERIETINQYLRNLKRNAGKPKALPSIKPSYQVTFDGFKYSQFSEQERSLEDPTQFTDTSVWETMDALVNSAIDNANEQILAMIGANGITANAFTALVGMGVPLKTSVFLMRQPIIIELSKSKYRSRAETGIRDLRERLEKIAKEEITDDNVTTESLSKHIFPGDYVLDIDSLSSADAIHYLKVLNQFEKAWNIGKSLELMATYLNIVREMPVTAETIGKMREVIDEIGEFNVEVSKDEYYNQFKKGGSLGTLITNDNFALDIPNFIKNNPHIAVAHQVFERLERLIETTFFVHSDPIKSFIRGLGLTGQIELAKGDRDSAILNRIEFAREFQKYLMSIIYKEKFEKDIPKFYYTNYKGEQEYLEGSKAWFQHFINKVEVLQKYLQKEAGNNNKLVNYFLFNLSISGNELRSIRYTAGSNLKYEDIILARDAFEELNKYSIIETIKEGTNPLYEVTVNDNPPDFTDFQKDFIVFSILNNGLQYSITSLSQAMPPKLFKESDAALQQISSAVKNNKQNRKNIRNHFKVSMVAANADQLKWVPRQGEQSELFMQGERTRFVQLRGNVIKPLIDTAGEYNGAYYDLAFNNKLEDKKASSSVFPQFIRTSEGRTAIAYIRLNDPTSDKVFYQRIGKNPSGFYEIADLNESYNISNYFNLKIPTVHATGIENSIITTDRSLDYLQDKIIALVDYRDITRQNRRFVKITKEISRQEGQQFKYEVEDAFNNTNEETEYLNNLFAEDDVRETYQVRIFGEEGFIKTEENKVTDAPNSIAKFAVGKDITEVTQYIKDNDGTIDIFEKICKG